METIEIFKALANEHRLQIIKWLKTPKDYFVNEGHPEIDVETVGVCVREIQKKLGLTQSTTSHYLTILQKSNLVMATRIGKWTYYRRNEATLSQLCHLINEEL
ncbi:TPA: helix-turn-helix transcriptional regulator [Streptococcus agalactiae]|uniref:ArsR/SmtB family transcription factor n=1 Tax=Streptococcus agalactiae TaxID=1311 RepID=UPI0003706CF7|nr:metalloregulator ArsR/SmtB family transcription factor [Streptococcus agalactiae]ASA91933.1 transcriptional regulator [Streptococcus agalactiae]KAA8982706.1 helix-turn-helix transcriptional regulator [Streptococcus agalactiae]MCC9770136.1 helix-turn-helix transcriptional regulator [Streptococcus agalactiae]MCC9774408.1 helix-turn-helix transcriptional regulator [Streptococcus agalactiae]MCC9776218.1 helix-turn-helix transcriptional regulator [Streptococcus agalactiae]